MMFLRPHIGASLQLSECRPSHICQPNRGLTIFVTFNIGASILTSSRFNFLRAGRVNNCGHSLSLIADSLAPLISVLSCFPDDEPRYWQNYLLLCTTIRVEPLLSPAAESVGISTGWVYCETSVVSVVQSANASKVQLERRLSGLRLRRSPVM
jgi:hypothetical protein